MTMIVVPGDLEHGGINVALNGDNVLVARHETGVEPPLSRHRSVALSVYRTYRFR